MSRFTSLLAIALLTTTTSAPLRAGGDRWPLDRAHSRVTFTVTKWGFAEVEGRFHDFEGAIAYDAERPEASHIDWRVKIASVETGESKRDATLLLPEYFDTARYPEMRFQSTKVVRVAADRLDVAGTITIKGVPKKLTVRVAYQGRHAVPAEGTFDMFQTEFTLNRYDFGIVGGSLLGPAISKEVRVKLQAAARQPSR